MSISDDRDGEGGSPSEGSPPGWPSAGDPEVFDDGAIDVDVDGDGGGDVRRSLAQVQHDDDDDDDYSIISGTSAGYEPHSGERIDGVVLPLSSCEGSGDGEPSASGNDLPSMPTPVDVANDGDDDAEDDDEDDRASGRCEKEAPSALPGATVVRAAAEQNQAQDGGNPGCLLRRAGIELSMPSGMQELIDTLQHDEETSLLQEGGPNCSLLLCLPSAGGDGDGGSQPTRILRATPRMTRTERQDALARARRWHEDRTTSVGAAHRGSPPHLAAARADADAQGSANARVDGSGESGSLHVDTSKAKESAGGRSGGIGTKTASANATSILSLGLSRGMEVASAGLTFIGDRDWHRPVTITLPVWCVLLIGVFLLVVSVVMMLLLAVSMFLVGIHLGGSGCGMSATADVSIVPQLTNTLGQCHSDTRLPQNVLDAITSEVRRHAQTVQPQTSKGSDKRANNGNGKDTKQKKKGRKNKRQKKNKQKNKGKKNKKQKKNKQKNKNQKEKQGNMAEKERKP